MNKLVDRFLGVHSALVTPFKKDFDLDLGAFSELVALQGLAKIDGVVVAGTTGEAPTLNLSERQELVKTALENITPNMVVIAGAGANCTKTAKDLQMAMEDAGAHATLQVVPYYNKPCEQGLFHHFDKIATSAKIPIILYNVPSRTGIDLSPKIIAKIAKESECVIGIKDASLNIARSFELICSVKAARPDFLVLAGEDQAFFPHLAMGGDGIISVTSQIASMEMKAIYQGVKNGDLIYARKIARKILGLSKLLFSDTNPLPIKTVLSAMGLLEKTFRLPLFELAKSREEQLLKRCSDFGFLKSFQAKGVFQ